VRLALEDTDRRVAEGRAVAPSFLLACLLWHDVQQRWAAARAQGEAPFPALQQAIDTVFDARIGDISGRGRIASDMREIWQMQPRFERRTAATAASLVEQPRFRAGYDFLRLRADVGEVGAELADWWEDYSLGTEEEREALVQDVKARAAPRKAPGRVARVAAADGARAGEPHEAADAPQDGESGEGGEGGEGQDGSAPRKRRRRRRRSGRTSQSAAGETGSSSGAADGAGPGQEGR
jgi:poly(A) polymerase